MLLALCVALIATGLGVALATVPASSTRLLGPIHTFALTASLAVVLAHLVPEAFAALGATALAVLVVGAIVPIALDAMARKLHRRAESSGGRSRLGLEAGYAGLLVHKLGDGLGLEAYAGPLGHGRPDLDVMIALAAHTVPVVAVVVLAFGTSGARRAGLARAAGIAVAMMLGVLIAGLVPAEWVTAASAWVAAAVSGLLLHVVMHDLGSHPPRTAADRTVDLGAALLGLVGPLTGSLLTSAAGEDGAAQHVATVLGHLFLDLLLDTAPLLLVGLLVGALIQSFGSRIPARWLSSRGPVLDALRGAVLGAPLPLCSCSVLPVSGALAQRAGPALVVAFLLTTPELGVETFALGARFLGWRFALLRLASALAISIVAGVVVARALGSAETHELAAHSSLTFAASAGSRRPVRRTLAAFDELLHHIGAWMVIGIATAALVGALVPAPTFAAIGHPLLQLAVVTLVAIPSYVCAPSATPLAAVLLAKGLSPGAVLVVPRPIWRRSRS